MWVTSGVLLLSTATLHASGQLSHVHMQLHYASKSAYAANGLSSFHGLAKLPAAGFFNKYT